MDSVNEEIIPLYANHLTMCRFAGETKEYKAVSSAILRQARKAHRERQARMRPTSVSSDRCM